jgi:putative ABC transport system substrate-binding protein
VANLVRRQVALIVATDTRESLAAKAATRKIPIVFQVGTDPAHIGLVPSLNRPGGNLTGVTSLNVETTPKQFGLLHELIPTATAAAASPVGGAETGNVSTIGRRILRRAEFAGRVSC